MQRSRARLEARATTVTLAVTAVALFASLVDAVGHLLGGALRPGADLGFLLANLVFLAVVGTFAYGNVVYQLTRWGAYRRMAESPPTLQGEIGRRPTAATLTVLVPSYREELQTVEQTLLSAALLRFPNKRIVLLLDDPPAPAGSEAAAETARTIELVERGTVLFDGLAARYLALAEAADLRLAGASWDRVGETAVLAEHLRRVAAWMEGAHRSRPRRDHTDDFFHRKVVLEAAAAYRERAARLLALAPTWSAEEARERLSAEYAALHATFRVDFSTFQRKRFANLSHEPNKAMNLNSYLSLLGGCFTVQRSPEGDVLVPVDPTETGANPPGDPLLSIPTSDYVLTLDADSLLDHRYAETLVDLLEQPENARVAVAQTPYSAIGGATSTLERVAGATTDIQYLIHQGFTRFGATYWVGANALLRKDALDDIAEPVPGEPLVRQFIQDRTVIEDTESSIDLVAKGWQLVNHPERLAYSATPPDYGALLIQRRRWANGGLIILPKLLRYIGGRGRVEQQRRPSVAEAFLRLHYLTSIAAVNVALVAMLFIPLDDVGMSAWVPLTAVPYFVLYARDLRLAGYRRSDLLRVYALNLLLVPVNLGGVAKSVEQLVTRRKIPFGRTPKVGTRTAAPPLYHVLTWLMIGVLALSAVGDLLAGHWLLGAMLTANVGFLLYGALRFIGLDATVADLRSALVGGVPSVVRRRPTSAAVPVFAARVEEEPEPVVQAVNRDDELELTNR